MKWTTYDQMHFLVVVDLLHLLIFPCMRLLFGKPLEISSLALFWVLLALLDQSFILLQLSISNVPRITTSMLAFQVPHLVYLLIGGKPLHLGRSDLSPRTILDTHLKWLDWLIQVMDLTWWVTSFFKSISFYLFKSFSFYLMISNSH